MSKEYIGSGKKHPNYDIVKVSIDIEKAMKFFHEYNGKQYLTFDVAAKRETDKYGKTHSVSVFIPDQQQENQPPEAAANSSFDDSEIPF